ncbi:serine/threonine protein kinase [Streptomyces sp. NBC_00536]|uniref:serine/threonine-protein kinase n=1 Tax=Streptomyces sp. NBC_00536 TaxID=2975769 RepID=UPI002E80F33C|nr:serine/threonine-protein kinase [Streptomyces sp. NBC_00536]WUC77663.1 serine/threonine protein kinase [Streptomyces sp. NBC_00536]
MATRTDRAPGPEEPTVRVSADTPGSEYAQVLPRGYRVGGWEVTEPIATGGRATVYAGRRVGGSPGAPGITGTPGTPGIPGEGGGGRIGPDDVALKFLPTAGLSPRQARDFADAARREAELCGRFHHPRLIRLLDTVVLSEPDRPLLDGAIVLVMERARCSLRDLLDGPVSEAEGARLIAEVCEGLAHLHRTGWVHGDLKPDNVLIMADGSVKLADFGIATELTDDDGTCGYAPPMGTFDYLPPERWKAPLGEHGVEVRPSADIWALGIVIHEVFASGSSPFPGATPMARGAGAQEYADGRMPLRLDTAVPAFWRALAVDCLAPTHAARAAHTAGSLHTRIAARTVADHVVVEPAAPRRRGRALAVLAAFAVCGTVAAGWAYAVHGDAGPAAPGGSGTPTTARVTDVADRVRVFNAEQGCRARTDRDAQCSLGLAIDPLRPYTAENVVATRVWHGDVLDADCQLPEGMPIIDESGELSTRWFHVRLAPGSARPDAWLPAVRTQDRPALPPCPRPAPTS